LEKETWEEAVKDSAGKKKKKKRRDGAGGYHYR
jgi:hypothetical protein